LATAPDPKEFAERAARALEAQGVAPPSSKLVPRPPAIMRFGKWVQPKINRLVGRHSKVGDRPVHDTAQFPWVAMLEAHAADIAAEARAVLGDLESVPPLAEVSPDHRRIAPAGKWRSYFLVGYGYRIPENVRACPKTAAAVAKVPGLNSAFFSILAPGSHIPPHTGVTKAIMTCHLALKVPQASERCRMRVVDEYLQWEEGKALVFDDTYNHEVLNDTDEVRVVLLVQFRRPMDLIGRIVGGAFLTGVRHSRFVQEARRGVIGWKKARG
jgi:beta-hydroxylase